MLKVKQLMQTNTTPYFHIRLPGTFKLYLQLDAKVTETQIFFPLQHSSEHDSPASSSPAGLREALHSVIYYFFRSLSTTLLFRPCNRTATPTGLSEVSSELRAAFHPHSVPLQWTRNSSAVAAGWKGLSTGQGQQALQSCLQQAATCLHSQVHTENLDSKAFGVCMRIPEKMWHKCWETPSSSAGLDVCTH